MEKVSIKCYRDKDNRWVAKLVDPIIKNGILVIADTQHKALRLMMRNIEKYPEYADVILGVREV
jgi:hypothetical protein